MGVLQLNHIHKSYGHVTILEDATVTLSTDQKIGFIGRNGAGKSTLCKIITGHDEPDAGTVSRSSDLRLAYLEQHDPYHMDETVMHFLMRYTDKEEWECGQIAWKFQLKGKILDTNIGQLAGGYRTRVKLTAMLLQEPNFLILDEPTNYLDLSTLILLENFLQDFDGGFLIVSHDREFLKRTCEHTMEAENGLVTVYPGSIEDYFDFKGEQINQKLAHNKEVERKKEQLQGFIDRFRAKASTAARAKSKMKQLARLQTIEIAHPLRSVTITLPPVERRAGLALACENLTIGYPDRDVASKILFDIERCSRVAVLGDNGQGKTTFLRTLAADLQPKGGSFRWASGLKLGYYAQHVFSTLRADDDVYTHLQRVAAPEVKPQEILNMAGAFLFRGDDVKKKVTVLSGGERARLCLAGLLLSKCQVLLLDEPTNHLDFETVEALGDALKDYSGTLFFISHDRTFVNLVANTIVEVKNGTVSRYPGKYEEYVYHLECLAREEGDNESEEGGSSSGEEQSSGSGKKPSHSSSGGGAGHEKDPEVLKLEDQIKKSENRMRNFEEEEKKLIEEKKKNPFHSSKQRDEKMRAVSVQIEKEEKQLNLLKKQLEKLKKEKNSPHDPA